MNIHDQVMSPATNPAVSSMATRVVLAVEHVSRGDVWKRLLDLSADVSFIGEFNNLLPAKSTFLFV